ncbi:MAG: hypothetical protein WKH64_07785 [Chloroflexia bacterium]
MVALAAAFRETAPLDEGRVRSALSASNAGIVAAVDEILNGPAALKGDTLLILDDYHEADERPELRAVVEAVLDRRPPGLKVILSTRYLPLLTSYSIARARAELMEVGQRDLAFDHDEAAALYALHDRTPPPELATWVVQSRGWPLALHALAANPLIGRLDDLSPVLDPYLTYQVLNTQPAGLAEYMLRTARLRWVDAAAAAETTTSDRDLDWSGELERRLLFIERDDQGRLAYQPLFRAFLQRVAETRPADRRGEHGRAAEYYLSLGDEEGVVHHLIAAERYDEAAAALEQSATSLLRSGGAEGLLDLLDRLASRVELPTSLLLVRGTLAARSGVSMCARGIPSRRRGRRLDRRRPGTGAGARGWRGIPRHRTALRQRLLEALFLRRRPNVRSCCVFRPRTS